jgi:hypothetical protein
MMEDSMIKKNTKIIFKGAHGEDRELVGGIPLAKGETVHVTENEEKVDYIVENKVVEFSLDGDDQIANIVYILTKSD